MTVAAAQQRPPHPVFFDVEYPERVSRVTTFFRLFMAVPQFIVVYLLLIAMGLITVLAWFAILFTGRYPKSFFEFASGVMRWQANVWAYVGLLRDEYPPFSLEPGEYPVMLGIPLAERQSRFRLFIRAFAIVPNYIVLTLVMYGLFFTTFLSWWAILFSGRYPRGLFKFSVGVLRWQQRQFAYLYLLRDEYPPYSINANARPGNEVVSAIIGLPLFAAYVALTIMPAFGLFGGNTTVYATLSPAAISRDHPSARSGSLRLTLLDYDDRASRPAAAGWRNVSFDVRAEKDGRWPSFFTPYLFFADLCDGGNTPSVDEVTDETSNFDVYWRGGSDTATIYFTIRSSATICQLSYFAGRGSIKFVFR